MYGKEIYIIKKLKKGKRRMKLQKRVVLEWWKVWMIIIFVIAVFVSLFSGWFSSEIQASEKSQSRSKAPLVSLPVVDWELLNEDGLDLKTYKEVKENTPVPLDGKIFDKNARQYCLFFGSLKGGIVWRYSDGKFSFIDDKQVPTIAYRNLESNPFNFPLQAMGMVGYEKKASPDHPDFSYPFSYDYPYGVFDAPTLSNLLGQARTGQGFDIAMVKNGQIIASPSNIGDYAISKQYIKKNDIVSYGFLYLSYQNEFPAFIPIRVHGYVADLSTGRLRWEVTVYNEKESPMTILPIYGLYPDVMGGNQGGTLFPNGTDGVYVEQSAPIDGIATRLYFYKDDSYPDHNGPQYYQIENVSVGYPNSWEEMSHNRIISPDPFTKNNPFGKGQPAVEANDEPFKLPSPAFVYRWDPINIESKKTATFALDMSVKELTPVIPDVSQSFENVTTTNGKNYVGDTLDFSLKVGNLSDDSAWRNTMVENVLPEHLAVDSSSFTLVDPDGIETPLPSSSYDSSTRTLMAGPYTVKKNKEYTIKFQAKITGDGEETIVNKMTVFGQGQIEPVESEVEIAVESNSKADLTVKFIDDDGIELHSPIVLTGKIGEKVNLSTNKKIKSVLDELLVKYWYDEVPKDTEVLIQKGGSEFIYRFSPKIVLLQIYFKLGDQILDPDTGLITTEDKCIATESRVGVEYDLSKDESITKIINRISQYYDLDEETVPGPIIIFGPNSKKIAYQFKPAQGDWTVKYLEQGTNRVLGEEYTTALDTGVEYDMGNDPKVKGMLEKIRGQHYTLVETDGETKFLVTKKGGMLTYYFQADLGKVKVRFQDAEGKELGDPIEVTGRIGSDVLLKEEPAVKARLDELAKQGYATNQNPAVKIKENETEYIFVLTNGDFSLKSAPKVLEFHDYQTGVYGKVTANHPDWSDQPLVVTDTRTHPQGWKVKVQMTEDFTARTDSDFSLKNILYYKRDHSKTPLSKGSETVVVYDNESDKQKGEINISELEWKNKGNGFSIELKEDQYRKLDDYDAKLLYTLEETP